MWVQLTRQQHDAAVNAIGDQWSGARAELTAEVRYSGERIVHVHAAFVAWEIARDALAAQAFGPNGGRKQGLPYPISAALRRITNRTNWLLKHPALRGAAVTGHHATQIPAWGPLGPDEFGRTWSPRPQLEAPFALLCPRFHDQSGGRFTTWSPRNGIADRHDRLADPEIHWAAVR